jgi:small subunit ribosomal protein S1
MDLQREELEKLYANTFKGLQEGVIVKGRVIQINQNGVIVDVGSKCEGFIPVTELVENEHNTLKPEDEVEVYVVEIGDSDDFIKLSRQRAERIKTWEMLENALDKGLPVEGKIIGKVKGGMTVDIGGVKAFLPGSQIDLKALKNTDHLIGQLHRFKVIKLNNKASNVIVSRRLLLEEERNRLREETLRKLKEGVIIKGTIKNLTDYGAFIDLGGVDGLLHISDMSWGRISHPSELFSIGDTVEVVVLTFDPETEKVTLGYKQKKPDPWTYVEEKYPPGKKVLGKVVSITDYGIFIELEEGVEGLVHVTEIDWSERIRKPSKYFSIGDMVEVVVLKVNKSDKRISLSIKQLKPNPWEIIKEKYTVGQKITGRVRSFTDFGAFISLNEGVDALLHISDISWTKHIKHPSEVLKKGQQIEVVILNIEPEKERISVGLKELTPDPWIKEIPNKYNLGDTVKGKVVDIADSGLLVELEDGVEGLIYAAEIKKTSGKKIDELFKIGVELTARIINVDTAERKIGLSMKIGD